MGSTAENTNGTMAVATGKFNKPTAIPYPNIYSKSGGLSVVGKPSNFTFPTLKMSRTTCIK